MTKERIEQLVSELKEKFQEGDRVIVVGGGIACGKEELTRQLCKAAGLDVVKFVTVPENSPLEVNRVLVIKEDWPKPVVPSVEDLEKSIPADYAPSLDLDAINKRLEQNKREHEKFARRFKK